VGKELEAVLKFFLPEKREMIREGTSKGCTYNFFNKLWKKRKVLWIRQEIQQESNDEIDPSQIPFPALLYQFRERNVSFGWVILLLFVSWVVKSRSKRRGMQKDTSERERKSIWWRDDGACLIKRKGQCFQINERKSLSFCFPWFSLLVHSLCL